MIIRVTLLLSTGLELAPPKIEAALVYEVSYHHHQFLTSAVWTMGTKYEQCFS